MSFLKKLNQTEEVPEVRSGLGPWSEARLTHLMKNSALGEEVRSGNLSTDELRQILVEDIFRALRDGAVTADELTAAELSAVEEYKRVTADSAIRDCAGTMGG